jgi:hypothetical protein
MFPFQIEKRYPLLNGEAIPFSAFLESSQLGHSEYYLKAGDIVVSPYAHTVEDLIKIKTKKDF